ncbi:gamma-glutamyltranspeptidase [Fomitopsis serialis]|uniref:gamma-glutamyltranspeptidase n=1 Tax=Fomitopsis serialis TaxID=139415 RepID=UPI00200796A8|nr:gamma-glutamyltranspeptidase [Neoantrodia serialis]KAH9935606.1 gamma-glutamyltranspeptidase [Neoantrodia serialis]
MGKHGALLADDVQDGGIIPLHRPVVYQRDRVRRSKVVVAITVFALALLFVARDAVAPSCRFSHTHLIHKPGSIRRPVPSGTRNEAYIVEATHGAVASENEVCSDIGVDILKQGGNAVDAAVSTTLCIGVLNMFSSGIGGGGFMTVRVPPSSPNASSEVHTIDFREMAPAASNNTMFVEEPMKALFGGMSVGVPGELRGLEEAHKRWGSLPWRTLVQPSVELARGWRMQRELSERIRFEFFKPLMLKDPDWSAVFAPEGQLLKEGEIVRRTNLSRTLAVVAEQGADALYKGPIADSLIKKIRATGGVMTREDLQNYAVHVRPALQGTYRGRKVYTSHAPTSGPVLLHMLNLMEHYEDLVGEGRTPLNSHRLIEAMKFGFAARTRVCDLAFSNDTRLIEEIPTKAYSNTVFPNITDDSTHTPDYYHPMFDIIEDHGTSHSSVVDSDGMAVAITSTVNLVFGSQVLDPETGVILNDQMDDFSTPGTPNSFGLFPSPFNYPEPGKRPLSSTVPTIVEYEDGTFYLATGGSGGSRIFPAVFQVILNMDWGMDVSAAIEHGRVHDQLYPTMVDADNTLPVDTLDALRGKRHNVTVSDINRIASVVQAVARQGDKIFAASDSRKRGVASGY